MDGAIPTPYVVGCATAVFCGLAAVLKWKIRRAFAARRVNRGLKVYATTNNEAVS
jgi:hypothetical protein